MTESFAMVPVVFLLYALVATLISLLFAAKANKTPGGEHELEPYACGQRDVVHFVAPSYYKVFGYAFFFTVMHVLVLVVATAPRDAGLLPVAYVLAGVVAMVILMKKRID